MAIEFVSPLPGTKYEQAWGPWGGTHARGQNWQSGSAWDLLVPEGLPCHSPIAGTVVSVGQGGTGRFAGAKVGIQGKECSVFLTHMSAVSVVKGQKVDAGQRVGTTGQANGVQHLHIGMGGPNYFDSSDANGIDPGPYLAKSARLLAMRGPKGYPWFVGEAFGTKNGQSLMQQLRNGGFGYRSAKQIVDAMAAYDGVQPGPLTLALRPALAAQLLKAGIGRKNAAKIIRALIIYKKAQS